MDTCETEDRKPFQASFPTKDDFWAGVDHPVLADPVFLNLKAEGHNQFSAPRHIHSTPVVVGPHPHNSVTNINSLITTSAAAAYPHNAILSDAERQQLFSRLPLNIPRVSAVATQVLFLSKCSVVTPYIFGDACMHSLLFKFASKLATLYLFFLKDNMKTLYIIKKIDDIIYGFNLRLHLL
jgi:hypothetical protein